jgi:hypothetical protein
LLRLCYKPLVYRSAAGPSVPPAGGAAARVCADGRTRCWRRRPPHGYGGVLPAPVRPSANANACAAWRRAHNRSSLIWSVAPAHMC